MADLFGNAVQEQFKGWSTDNPYNYAGNAFGGLGKIDYTSIADGNPWANVLASVLGGFGQGAMGGMSRNYADDKMQGLAGALAQANQTEDPAGYLARNPEYGNLAAALQTDLAAEDRATQAGLQRIAGQYALADSFQRGGGGGIRPIVTNGKITFENAPAREAAPMAPMAASSSDPMIQDLYEGMAAAQARGLKENQATSFANNYAERKQMERSRMNQMEEAAAQKRLLAAQAEASKDLVTAERYAKDAQQLENALRTRGDEYTGMLGGLKYEAQKAFMPNDPKVQAAKELDLLGMGGVRDLRSDSQIAEAERKMLMGALPTGTAPTGLLESRAQQLRLGAETATAKAQFIQDAAQKGMSPDQAKLLWTQAYGKTDLYTDDPATGSKRWLTPDEFRASIFQRLSPESATPAAPAASVNPTIDRESAIAELRRRGKL